MPFCIVSKFAQNHCVFKDFLNFLQIGKSRLLRHPGGVKNFNEMPLPRMVKEIEENLCFSIFGKNSKWPSFLGRGKSFENCQE